MKVIINKVELKVKVLHCTAQSSFFFKIIKYTKVQRHGKLSNKPSLKFTNFTVSFYSSNVNGSKAFAFAYKHNIIAYIVYI